MPYFLQADLGIDLDLNLNLNLELGGLDAIRVLHHPHPMFLPSSRYRRLAGINSLPSTRRYQPTTAI
jgi:hypothetical protein